MSWINAKDLKPPTHEVILFQDRWRNEHYGVLCGQFSKEENRGKYWCHLYQKSYAQKDIIYWCEIPINRHLIRQNNELTFKVNAFLWESINKIEESILNDFKKQQEENPDWNAEQFMGIAVRNMSFRIMDILKATKE